MSPSAAEKKALAFLLGVLVIGGFMKAIGAARRGEAADAASREALRRQIVAAESAAAVERRERSGRGRGGGRPSRTAGVSTGGAGAVSPGPPSIFDPPAPRDRIDVDRANAEELEALPRIGPALAARIVEDRERNGAFGSLEALQRVRGIGPAMARQLGSAVTFSGTPRPSIAGEAGARPSIEGRGTRRRPKTARAYPPP
ncbi:MAG TPA: helix-hairpin-helix domain-containing protein [Gemmatimonadaceae bacterium]|nr:helix-hairpin-helix domain-containing protein [Gemmatimonadaceae bacterium]